MFPHRTAALPTYRGKGPKQEIFASKFSRRRSAEERLSRLPEEAEVGHSYRLSSIETIASTNRTHVTGNFLDKPIDTPDHTPSLPRPRTSLFQRTLRRRQPWSPHVEMALFNRTVRLSIFCNNINAREEGYVLFKVGDGSETFDLTLKEYEAILSGETSSSTKRGVGGFSSWLLPGVLSLVAAAVLSVALTGVAP